MEIWYRDIDFDLEDFGKKPLFSRGRFTLQPNFEKYTKSILGPMGERLTLSVEISNAMS
jgi:hypothetical protein